MFSMQFVRNVVDESPNVLQVSKLKEIGDGELPLPLFLK